MNNDYLISFKKHLEKTIPIPQDIWEKLEAIIRLREIKKDDFVVKENQLYNQELFICQGVVRGFYSSDSGEEFNVSFYQDNEIFIPWGSRTKNGRSNISFQALTHCVMLEFDQDTFRNIRNTSQELYKYGSMVQEHELNKKIQREKTILLKSAEERYILFQKAFPNLENRISQYHVASYLGITPVSLSRLRKHITTRKKL